MIQNNANTLIIKHDAPVYCIILLFLMLIKIPPYGELDFPILIYFYWFFNPLVIHFNQTSF